MEISILSSTDFLTTYYYYRVVHMVMEKILSKVSVMFWRAGGLWAATVSALPSCRIASGISQFDFNKTFTMIIDHPVLQ